MATGSVLRCLIAIGLCAASVALRFVGPKWIDRTAASDDPPAGSGS